jgi:hypothetical protein
MLDRLTLLLRIPELPISILLSEVGCSEKDVAVLQTQATTTSIHVLFHVPISPFTFMFQLHIM